ncbi:heme exporter protein C [Thermosporothrix hazakensis]|jgi:heme exporter protein C|uniref:Heme exporter protein C n=2 Tax=Thermosporothrix TaxID=768650 RepID=A0A326U0L3_THEHA|nr:cytochrome c biogenesis protein CcsA [Thermosporothrix hazakensis]PZW23927.1 heme exporter protein C [Thermosporothrix hazakensis]BBH90437.1 hypothetical protein KTC_51880 [Thermosporothrix sp. COM3]GCE48474.1 hypothetical protein KTH_33430 [Thermosporothrix hazakensis]
MALTDHTLPAERKAARVAGQERDTKLPLVSLVLAGLSLIGGLISAWMIFLYAPTDALQKDPQRIFYLHLACAWVGMLAFVLLAVTSIVALIRRNERWDWISRANAEVGAVFLTIALVTGSLWGRPIWGAWWVWEPKLTATLIMWFMYIGYLMLRSYMGRTLDSMRVGAVMAILGAIDVPIIYLAVNWWRGQHPTQVSQLPPEMLLTMLVVLLTFTIFYVFLVMQVYQLQRLQTLAQRLRLLVMR